MGGVVLVVVVVVSMGKPSQLPGLVWDGSLRAVVRRIHKSTNCDKTIDTCKFFLRKFQNQINLRKAKFEFAGLYLESAESFGRWSL